MVHYEIINDNKWEIKTRAIKYCSAKEETERRDAPSKALTVTHITLGICIGADIDQQPHILRVTIDSGINQRRTSSLQVRYTAAERAQHQRHGENENDDHEILCEESGHNKGE